MTVKSRVTFALLCALALSGCVNREQADAKLGRACAAAVGAIMEEGQTMGEVKKTEATASPVGPDYRYVKITSVTMDGWLESENEYECTFQEGFGFLNSGYTASLYEAKVGEKVVGQAGNKILGSAEEHMKVIEAVRKALYE